MLTEAHALPVSNGMKQTTKRFLSMILGAVFLVASLVVYFQFIQPAYEDAQTIKAQQLSEQSFLDSESQTIKQVQNLISNYQSQEQIQEVVSAALPMQPDQAGAIAQIYGLALNSSLAVQSISISVGAVNQQQGPAVSDTGAMVNQAADFAVALQKPIGTIDLHAHLVGPYDNLKNFLSIVEKNIRILDVKSLSLQSVVQPTSATGKNVVQPIPIYSYDLSLSTYYQGK